MLLQLPRKNGPSARRPTRLLAHGAIEQLAQFCLRLFGTAAGSSAQPQGDRKNRGKFFKLVSIR